MIKLQASALLTPPLCLDQGQHAGGRFSTWCRSEGSRTVTAGPLLRLIWSIWLGIWGFEGIGVTATFYICSCSKDGNCTQKWRILRIFSFRDILPVTYVCPQKHSLKGKKTFTNVIYGPVQMALVCKAVLKRWVRRASPLTRLTSAVSLSISSNWSSTCNLCHTKAPSDGARSTCTCHNDFPGIPRTVGWWLMQELWCRSSFSNRETKRLFAPKVSFCHMLWHVILYIFSYRTYRSDLVQLKSGNGSDLLWMGSEYAPGYCGSQTIPSPLPSFKCIVLDF